MRHRATRPFTGLLLRLPRLSAQRLGLTAARPARALGVLVAVLLLGSVGYALVASVVGGNASPQAEPPERSVTAEPPTSRTPEPTATPTPSGDPRPTERPEEPAAPTSPRPEAPAPTNAVSPSAGEGPGRLPPIATRSAPPSPRPTSTATGDVAPPDTTVSHEVTGPGQALLMISADEAARFACSLDGAAYSSCGSTQRYSDLHPGWHSVSVRATDPAGNVDTSPASTRWHSTNGGPAIP